MRYCSPVSSFQPVYNQTIKELSTILLSPQVNYVRDNAVKPITVTRSNPLYSLITDIQ